MNIQTMVDYYQERIDQYSVAIDAEKAINRTAKKNEYSELEIALQIAEIKRLNDLRQLCIQVIKDLDLLG